MMAKKMHGDMIDRNQKIEGQVHLRSRSPVIKGATLGGVFRLPSHVSSLGLPIGCNEVHTILRVRLRTLLSLLE